MAEGYKALDPLDLRLHEKLLLLIGSNGAGKSSTLQALAFPRYFIDGKGEEFFQERGWSPQSVKSKTLEHAHNTLRYHLLFEGDDDERVLWQFSWGLNTRKNLQEQMWWCKPGEPPRKLFSYAGRQALLKKDLGEEIRGLQPAGSILQIVDPDTISEKADAIQKVREWAARINSLELLSPISMRGSDRGSPKGIGVRGQRLAGFLAALDPRAKSRVVERLREFYPVEGLTTTRKQAGWVDLKIAESFGLGDIQSQHVSDGFLRLLALCSIPEFRDIPSIVLLDEIEDGIEPHILPLIIDRVSVDSSAQFVVTSHSPLLANFFDISQITLVVRNTEGRSRFIPLGEVDIVKAGLEYQGPGEIWANSPFHALQERALATVRATDFEFYESSRFSDLWSIRFMVLN